MKNFIILAVLIFSGFISCTEKSIDVEIKAKPVKIITARNETKTVFSRHIGSVISSDIKKLGFKIPGKINSINVKKGDRIKKGRILASLETEELNFALDAAKNTLRKAEDYYNETASFYSKIKDLYDSGAVPGSDHDKAKLAMDTAKLDMENAKVDLEHKKKMLSDAALISDIDGFVVEVLNEKGEIVSAGYPVVVIRNESLIVKTGVPVKDLRHIKIGTDTIIDINGSIFDGKVTNIADIPDEKTRTYSVEADIIPKNKNNKLYLGSIAKVDFNIGKIEGIWVPVFSLLTDGTDYVYTAGNGIALRKNVSTGHISGEFVLVEGLSEGDKIIVEGMKDINDGDKVAEK